jgi:hypothetical protein
MELQQVYDTKIEHPDDSVKFFSILPPSNLLAQAICAIANKNTEGYIFIGITELSKGKVQVKELSNDFNIMPILHKAIDRIKPIPAIAYNYYTYQGKNIFAIKVTANAAPYLYNGIHYIINNGNIIEANLSNLSKTITSYPRITACLQKIVALQHATTDSKAKVLSHYLSTLRLIDSVSKILMPQDADTVTNDIDGWVLLRLLVCSIFDNLEIYLGDLLFEIWLSNPNMLKSTAEISVEEVLNCSDIEEFVRYYARKRISNMTKGSIKKFIKENTQIASLKAISDVDQQTIDNLMQIRHLFTHRNGIVDDKFSRKFRDAQVGSDYMLTVNEVINHLEYLIDIIHQVDKAAIAKYGLATT